MLQVGLEVREACARLHICGGCHTKERKYEQSNFAVLLLPYCRGGTIVGKVLTMV